MFIFPLTTRMNLSTTMVGVAVLLKGLGKVFFLVTWLLYRFYSDEISPVVKLLSYKMRVRFFCSSCW